MQNNYEIIFKRLFFEKRQTLVIIFWRKPNKLLLTCLKLAFFFSKQIGEERSCKTGEVDSCAVLCWGRGRVSPQMMYGYLCDVSYWKRGPGVKKYFKSKSRKFKET